LRPGFWGWALGFFREKGAACRFAARNTSSNNCPQACDLFLQYFILSLEPRDVFCGMLFCYIDKITASRMQATTFLRKMSRR
jgi:hypothetical protein